MITPRIGPRRAGSWLIGTVMWIFDAGLSMSPWTSAAVSWLSTAPDPARSSAAHSLASRGGTPLKVA